MCKLVCAAIADGNAQVLKDVRKIARSGDEYTPDGPRDLASKIFYTAYMGSTNSSAETRARAKTLAAEIGATHTDLDIDRGTDAIMAIFKTATGKTPMFSSSGGTPAEDVALQNIQARMRMVLAYVSAFVATTCPGPVPSPPLAHGSSPSLDVGMLP